MLRPASAKELASFGLDVPAQPMIWAYGDDPANAVGASWKRYASSGLKRSWAAGAFKVTFCSLTLFNET